MTKMGPSVNLEINLAILNKLWPKVLWSDRVQRNVYIQTTFFFLFREDLEHSRRARPNCIMHSLQQHGSVAEESRCYTDILTIQTFYQLKTFSVSLNVKYDNEDSGLLNCRILYETRFRQYSSVKAPATCLLSSQKCINLKEVKRRGDITQW